MRTNKRCERSVMTINGPVYFPRYVLRPKTKGDYNLLLESEKVTSVTPMDYYLGLIGLPFKMTVAAMLEVAYWAQNQCSYQAAEDAIHRTCGINVNDDTVRLVANAIGAIVHKNDVEVAEAAYGLLNAGKLQFGQKKPGILYVETDGAALNTRRKDVNGSSWRENKLATVFSSDNIRFWSDGHGQRQHKIMKKEYVSLIGNAEEFQKHLLACALRNGYGCYETTIILSDGATWIRNMKELLFPDAQQILDYFHLCENVYAFAKHVYGVDETRYKPWAKRICDQLKASQYQEVLKELKKMRGGKVQTSPVNLYGYIFNNINNIDYASYIKKGYFIGSGAIESANKTVLQKRLKQAGIRWNTSSAQNLLTLRAKRESGLWLQDVIWPIMRHFGVPRCKFFGA